MKKKHLKRTRKKVKNTVQKTIPEAFLLVVHWTKIQNHQLNKNENRLQKTLKEYSGVDPIVEVKETCFSHFFFFFF